MTSELTGRRVLVVEDELLIALEIRHALERLGCVVVGPAGSIDAALKAMSGNSRPDAALLDVNLRGKHVTPVAKACQDLCIPFALITGYGRLQLSEPLLHSARRISKPFHQRDIGRTLVELLT